MSFSRWSEIAIEEKNERGGEDKKVIRSTNEYLPFIYFIFFFYKIILRNVIKISKYNLD